MTIIRIARKRKIAKHEIASIGHSTSHFQTVFLELVYLTLDDALHLRSMRTVQLVLAGSLLFHHAFGLLAVEHKASQSRQLCVPHSAVNTGKSTISLSISF